MGNPIGGPRLQTGQATDIAPATAEAGIVYVVGVKPLNPVPQEMNWLGQQPVFEDRYKNNFFYFVSPNNDANSRQLKFSLNPADKWMRIRTACFLTNWTFSGATAALKDTTFTPLPGFGVTNWDQINVLVGSSGQPMCNTSMHAPHLHMLNFLGNVKKNNIILNEWYKMAGFDDFKTFDYAGPIDNSTSYSQTSNPTNITTGDTDVVLTNSVLTAEQFNFNSRFVYGSTFGEGNTSFPAFLPGSSDRREWYYPFNNRVSEGGMWYDPAMRRMRKAFYGNKNCTNTNTLVKASIFCSPMESILLWPPMQMEFQFFFNNVDEIRPRGIITPCCTIGKKGATGDTAGSQYKVTVGDDAGEFIKVGFNKDKCYFLMQFVEMRSDIHQAFLFSWAQNSGSFVQPVTWLDLYMKEGIYSRNTLQIDLIGQQGMIPYKTCFATTPLWPFGANALNGGEAAHGVPAQKHFCEFSYGNCNIEEWSIDTTMPTSRTHHRKVWDKFENGCDPQAISELSLRGVRSHEYWQQEKINRNQGFLTAVLEDCDSLDFADTYEYQMAPPHGQSYQKASGTKSTVYGSHSVLCAGQTTPTNFGLHNFVNSFLWTPIGVDMPGLNYGVYRGNQRLTAKFNPTPAIPLKLMCLNSYQICLQLGGNGVAQKNLAI